MSFFTYLNDVSNVLACGLCVFRNAFDQWSLIKLGDIIFWGIVVGIMDSLVKRWFRISSASKGNIFKFKPVPGKDLQFNWEYVDTLDLTTKINFHRLIQVTHGRLMYAGYSKLTKFLVVHFIL